jgi:hypothetical protein
MILLRVPDTLFLANGKHAKEKITHYTRATVDIGGHTVKTLLYITNLRPQNEIILGAGGLLRHGPRLNFDKLLMTFLSPYCRDNCLAGRGSLLQIPFLARSPEQSCRRITQATFLAQRPEHFCDRTTQAHPVNVMASSEKQDKSTLRSLIQSQYHDLLDTFRTDLTQSLPPRQYINHAIILEPGSKPPFRPLYSMSEDDLKLSCAYTDEMLKRGFIRLSQFPAGTTLFFIRQKEKIRPVVDYRALNEITIKNCGPTPLTTELLDQLRSAKVFTKIDLRDAFHQIQIKEGDKWKTAFPTRDGHFEYLVMPFGLCNVPATFQQFITKVLRKFVDRTCVVYLDDILVYSESEEEHPGHVRKVVKTLQDVTCAIKAKKC